MKKKHLHHAHAVKKKTVHRRPHAFTKTRAFFLVFLRTGAMVIVLGLGASLVALDPTMLRYFQASITGDIPATVEDSRQSSLQGVLLTHSAVPENESKLTEVFQNVFPEMTFQRLSNESDPGKNLIETLQIRELPTILFEKNQIEQEPLFATVRDLFEEKQNFFVLRTAMVNPSFQVRLDSLPAPVGSYTLGDDAAKSTLMLFSDVTCTHCRVLERSLLQELRKRIGESSLRVVFVDMPEEEKSIPFSSSLSCLQGKLQSPDATLTFREKLIARPNLSLEYVDLELTRAGVSEGLKACDANASRLLYDAKLSIAKNFWMTSLPAVFIGKTGGDEWVRISGAKEWDVYKNILDR